MESETAEFIETENKMMVARVLGSGGNEKILDNGYKLPVVK